MNSDFSKILISGFLLAAIAGFVVFRNSNKSELNNKPVVFQPEAQMISQGIDATKGATTSRTLINDKPITAKNDGVKYVYSKDVCINNNNFKCFSSYYEQTVKNFGAGIAMNDIKKRATENGTVLTVCHPLTHTIGRTASASYKTAGEAFLHGDSYCWSGYFHGILEGIIDRIGAKNLPKELNNICADIPGRVTYNFDYYNCVHGIGHGIMSENEDEVFLSLKMCDNLDGAWEKESCYSGVYMQNIIDNTEVADSGNKVKYLKPSEPLYPCTAVEDRYKGQCYLGQTSYALQVTGYDYKKVFDLCSSVEAPYRNICNQSMGRDVANQMRHDAKLTKEKCLIPSNQDDVDNCIIGAAKEIISYYHSDKESLAFCNILDGKTKDMCISVTNSYYSLFK